MVSTAQMNAVNKYIKGHMRRFTLQCNKETEADIIEYLESADSYNTLLKRLIREQIAREKDSK